MGSGEAAQSRGSWPTLHTPPETLPRSWSPVLSSALSFKAFTVPWNLAPSILFPPPQPSLEAVSLPTSPPALAAAAPSLLQPRSLSPQGHEPQYTCSPREPCCGHRPHRCQVQFLVSDLSVLMDCPQLPAPSLDLHLPTPHPLPSPPITLVHCTRHFNL